MFRNFGITIVATYWFLHISWNLKPKLYRRIQTPIERRGRRAKIVALISLQFADFSPWRISSNKSSYISTAVSYLYSGNTHFGWHRFVTSKKWKIIYEANIYINIFTSKLSASQDTSCKMYKKFMESKTLSCPPTPGQIRPKLRFCFIKRAHCKTLLEVLWYLLWATNFFHHQNNGICHMN